MLACLLGFLMLSSCLHKTVLLGNGHLREGCHEKESNDFCSDSFCNPSQVRDFTMGLHTHPLRGFIPIPLTKKNMSMQKLRNKQTERQAGRLAGRQAWKGVKFMSSHIIFPHFFCGFLKSPTTSGVFEYVVFRPQARGEGHTQSNSRPWASGADGVRQPAAAGRSAGPAGPAGHPRLHSALRRVGRQPPPRPGPGRLFGCSGRGRLGPGWGLGCCGAMSQTYHCHRRRLELERLNSSLC